MEIEENTVPAWNQMAGKETISFENSGGDGLKIAFVGNSITRHAPAPALGWYGDWGMAASSREKDYVHRVLEGLRRRGKTVSACICNASEWERGYADGFPLDEFTPVRDFCPNILVMRVLENCPTDAFKPQAFERAYEALIAYLKADSVILTTSFWKHPGDAVIQAVAKKCGYPCIYLGELGEREEMKTTGQFAHTGVAAHPGDDGMAYIARAILENIKETRM